MQPASTGAKILTAILILAVLMTAIIGYSSTHKPLDAESGLGLFKAAWQILVPVLIVALAGGLGKRLIGEHETNATHWIMEAALGLGLMSFLLGGLAISIFLLALNPKRLSAGWENIFTDHEITWVILPPNAGLALYLSQNVAWEILYSDSTAVILRIK